MIKNIVRDQIFNTKWLIVQRDIDYEVRHFVRPKIPTLNMRVVELRNIVFDDVFDRFPDRNPDLYS